MAQCTATSKQTGNRCRRPASRGATVCRHHGGAAPQVKAAAQRRLLEAVDPLVSQLLVIAMSPEESTRDRLVAIRDALDRAGLREPDRVEVITVDMLDAEIARLQAELGRADEPAEA